MPILKLRGLGQFGVLTDIDPYDLPPQAFSNASNVRFSDQHVEAAPVFKSARVLATQSPRHLVTRVTTSGEDVFVGYLNGSVALVSPSSETDKSIAGYTPSNAETPYTNTTLARVLYVNRGDRVPWAYTPAATQFATLPNWDSTWRCKLLRNYNNALIAFNMTKAGVDYPTQINTSSFATDGNVPASWDYTNPSTNCYQNIISSMKGGIVDAQVLRTTLYIYGLHQTYVMRATGDTSIYAIDPLFTDRGAINTNCVVEIDGRHYVFGLTDIYMHDGITPVSLVDGKVRKFIFSALDRTKSNFCFVNFDPNLKEVRFCYVSQDGLVRFNPSVNGGCNKAAVYNLVNQTWTFYDLPYIYGAATASFGQSITWDNYSGSWDTDASGWDSAADTVRRGVLKVGDTVASYGLTAKIYAHDLYAGGLLSFAVDVNACSPAYLERNGLDLELIAPQMNLRGYKVINSIYPQARIAVDGSPLSFNVGGSDYFNVAPTMDIPQTYDGNTLYKLDFNIPGRYLFYQMNWSDYRNFTLTGIDIDLLITGQR